MTGINLSLLAMDLDKNYGYSLKYKLDVVSPRKNFTKDKRVIAIAFFFHAGKNQPMYINPGSALFQTQPD